MTEEQIIALAADDLSPDCSHDTCDQAACKCVVASAQQDEPKRCKVGSTCESCTCRGGDDANVGTAAQQDERADWLNTLIMECAPLVGATSDAFPEEVIGLIRKAIKPAQQDEREAFEAYNPLRYAQMDGLAVWQAACAWQRSQQVQADAGAAPPFTGHWRGGNGVISCGTLRIFSENFDTNPADNIKAGIVKWVCDTLNAAQRAHPFPAGESDKRAWWNDCPWLRAAEAVNELSGEVLARGWFHPREDGDYEIHDASSFINGPDCDKCIPCVIVRAATAAGNAEAKGGRSDE